MNLQLYHHIYHKYGEMEEAGVNDVAEEALLLDIDMIEHEHKKELETKNQELQALKLLLKHTPDQEILALTGITEDRLKELRM